MNVSELIQKLDAIDTKWIEVFYFCKQCGHFIPIDNMKEFGFEKPNAGPSSLMKRLAEIMPKKPQPVWEPNQMMATFRVEPIRQHVDSFAAWMHDDLPTNSEELRAMLWTFGEILSGDMERRLNAMHKIADDLQRMLPPAPVVIEEGN